MGFDPPQRAQRPTVAVIGGGFSGLLTALHLLADPDGPTVRLVERRPAFGRGAAYSTANPDHLLNVRVANMSAFPDQPDHFTRWLAEHSGWSAQGGFVTRGVYGDYLQDLLRQAVIGGDAGRLLLEADEAVDVAPDGSGCHVSLALGRAFRVDAVVVALGVLRPAAPAAAPRELIASSRYLADPWSAQGGAPEDAQDVLLIGTGLTMVDAAISHARPGRRFWAISRRGLAPTTHGPVSAVTPRPQPAGSPAAILRQVRSQAAAADWREAIDGVRPHVRAVWQGWTPAERRSFLRHLRPWWDVRRHRLAPAVARRLHAMTTAHELTLLAGRVERLTLVADGVDVAWAPRGSRLLRRLHVAAVINCTGVAGDIAGSGEPLIGRLLERGLVRADPYGLGLEVSPDSRLIARDGAVQRNLLAVGPLTRGAFWEMTSVPDIRVQAQDTARLLIGQLAGEVRP